MNKKILKILSAVLAAAVAVCGAAGCTRTDADCEHDVSKWITVTEPTCTETGVEEGICALCGETLYRDIEIDSEAHSYGDWVISSTPTESRMGSAKKTCTACGNELVVALPVLSSNLYTTSIVTRPSATADGVRSYSYYHELGNIEFTTKISSSGITSVMDAVDVACDDISHDAVRSGTGTVANAYYESGRTATSSTSYPFSYEYGENYTHIDDTSSDGKERWYGIDEDGEVYGYRSDYGGTPFDETERVSGAENYIYGYRYIFVYATYVGTYYGTEYFISGLYNTAKLDENGDFEEKVTEYASGDTEYTFSYGARSSGSTYFSQIKVTFTLSSEYTIKTLTAECTTYVNNSDDDSTTWKINDDGYAVVTAATGMRYVSTFTVTQTTKTEDPVEPVNPYTAETMRISSYDIIYNNNIDSSGKYVGDGTVVGDDIITITAREATQSTYTYKDSDSDVGDSGTVTATVNHFYLTNVLPSTMADSVADDLTFYYREYSGSTYVDYEISSTTATDGSSSVGVACTFNSSDNSFFILSKISGYVDIVLKTHNTEKIIHFYVTPIAPTTLYPMIYAYSTSGYTWGSTYQTAVSGTVYAGQNLYFSSDVPDTEVKFADAEYTVSVTSAVDSNGYTISSEYYTLVSQYDVDFTFNGQSMSYFNAAKAGTYTLTLVSVRDSSITSTITVTVNEVPDNTKLFSGSYTAKLSYSPKGNVTVTFTTEGSGVYYASIVSADGTEVLKCTYDGATLTTEHYSGTDSGFTLTFNEAYDLVISHSTGYIDDELGTDIMETVILTKSS